MKAFSVRRKDRPYETILHGKPKTIESRVQATELKKKKEKK